MQSLSATMSLTMLNPKIIFEVCDLVLAFRVCGRRKTVLIFKGPVLKIKDNEPLHLNRG
jgi:hypothetical protein